MLDYCSVQIYNFRVGSFERKFSEEIVRTSSQKMCVVASAFTALPAFRNNVLTGDRFL